MSNFINQIKKILFWPLSLAIIAVCVASIVVFAGAFAEFLITPITVKSSEPPVATPLGVMGILGFGLLIIGMGLFIILRILEELFRSIFEEGFQKEVEEYVFYISGSQMFLGGFFGSFVLLALFINFFVENEKNSLALSIISICMIVIAILGILFYLIVFIAQNLHFFNISFFNKYFREIPQERIKRCHLCTKSTSYGLRMGVHATTFISYCLKHLFNRLEEEFIKTTRKVVMIHPDLQKKEKSKEYFYIYIPEADMEEMIQSSVITLKDQEEYKKYSQQIGVTCQICERKRSQVAYVTKDGVELLCPACTVDKYKNILKKRSLFADGVYLPYKTDGIYLTVTKGNEN